MEHESFTPFFTSSGQPVTLSFVAKDAFFRQISCTVQTVRLDLSCNSPAICPRVSLVLVFQLRLDARVLHLRPPAKLAHGTYPDD